MRILPFCYIIDYFQRKRENFKRKREEKRNALKAELLAELLPVLDSTSSDLVKSVRKDISSAVTEFNDEIDKKKNGLEAQVKELRDDVRRYEQKSRTAIESAKELRKNSERMQAAAQDAKKEADVVVDSMKAMEEIVSKAEKFYAAIDAKLDEYTGIAVRQCTEAVAAEMNKAVQEAREEYKLNKEEISEFVTRITSQIKTAVSDDINSKYEVLAGQLKSEYADISGKSSALVKQFESAVADKQYVINALNFIRHNLPVVAYALQLSDLQKHLLRELFSDAYAGNITKLKENLDEKSKTIQDKRSFTPEEIDIKFAKRDLNEMVRSVKMYNIGNLRKLLEAVDRLENVYKRPESSRQEKH